MAKIEKKRFGIRSYRVRYTIELLTFTILVCLIMGNTIYNQAAAIIQANLSDNVAAMTALEGLRGTVTMLTVVFGVLSLALSFLIVSNIRKPLREILNFAIALA